jgi:isoquinoline 1-oxidoreductase beta subunit
LSRRSFLVASGGFTVGLSFVGAGHAQQASAAGGPAVFKPNAWVTIDTDGIVTLMSPSAEIGQGAMTGVPLCLANELDADWSKVRVQHAPSVPAVFGNPLAHMAMSTHADYSIQGYFDKVRMIGAQTRRILMGAAAVAWQVPLNELNTEPGRVVHAASGRSIGYGELARTAQVPDKLPELTQADLKPREQWRLIGRTTPRVDVPGKVNGSAVFGIDVQLPGMLYAAMLYPPVRHEKPVKVDDALARAIPGVREIVVLDRGVGVIGDTVQATRAAKNALQVQWSSQSPARQYDSSRIPADYQGIANDLKQAGVAMRKNGDAPAHLAAAPHTITREFHSAHVAHATIEPPNATARIDAGGVTLWLGTQSPSHVIATACQALGLKPEQVTVNTTFVGGAFGRLGDDSDAALDAMLLARAVPGRPVKLIRSREDEFLNDVMRPLAVQRVDASLDEQGRIRAWRHRVVASSHLGRTQPYVLDNFLHGQDVVSGLYDHPYGWQDELVQYVRADRGWDVGAFRGVAMGYTNFAAESVIDEIAAQLHVDPVAYRLRLLETNARGRAVLQRVAQMARWNQARPRGRALGVAMARMSETTAAQVVEVSVTPKREIRVHKAWMAADAGTLVNPDSVRAQLEGGTVMGLGPALYEVMAIKAGEPQALNFAGYFPPRMSQVPESIEVELLATEHPPGGVGEIGLTMVAPAIAAAVARLTGKRLRSLPLRLA